MKHYRIGVQQIWEQGYLVDATSEEDAISKMRNYVYGNRDREDVWEIDEFDCIEDMSWKTWNVEEAEDVT